MGTHRFVIEDTEYEVRVGTRSGNSVRVTVNGKDYDVDIAGPDAAASPAPVAPSAAPAPSAPVPAAVPAASGGGQVRAPISGVVLRVAVQAGQSVSRGTELLILEAMKMENPILATVDGVVQSVEARPQQDVREGDVLVTIQVG